MKRRTREYLPQSLALVSNEVAMTHFSHHLSGGRLSHFVGATSTILLAQLSVPRWLLKPKKVATPNSEM